MDVSERIHQDWLGMAQPEGLVVTASVLKQAGANITWPVEELQARLKAVAGDGSQPLDLRRFLHEILDWEDEFVVEAEQLPDTLRFTLEGGELLEPRLAVKSADDDSFVLLVKQEPERVDLDKASEESAGTPAQRFERLLRESGVFVGLITNGRVFRLIYAPKGESSGWITFRLNELLQVDGRALLGAFHMLLNQARLLTGEPGQRLAGLLKASREFQNTVSEKLREQVLAALRELLTGFQDADRRANGGLLRDYQHDRHTLYIGLTTTLMRMVFVLYAEERKLLPMDSELYADNYSLTQLYSQLVQDRDRYGADALDGRYGAWARVITLFRMLHDGARWFDGTRLESIPARRGAFFTPDAFPFLEGRARAGARQTETTLDPPKLSDGVLFRVLNHLLLLDGERLQYKGLDVEQIGSVYEGLMGFDVELADGESVPLTSKHIVVDLEKLLAKPPADRVKELKALGVDVKGNVETAVKKAATAAELKAALERRIPKDAHPIPKGHLYLQPGEERRRTGSHYTPRKLTAPIVETTLRPLLEQLGPEPKPEQILALKVCDPAMGSGAFLVEACRQLADHLVAAWRRAGTTPKVPEDEDLTLHARRLIAQRCLYGVDKNPLAVDLARLSMWLVTFAKLHPFTFVDHALRHGDSLVGLSGKQIAAFSWDEDKPALKTTFHAEVANRVAKVKALRLRIHEIGDPPDITELTQLWKEAQEELHVVRLLGDLVIAAFFGRDGDKARRTWLETLANKVQRWLLTGEGEAELRALRTELRGGTRPVPAFHWEVEFPEVFETRGGFDAAIGNPPFAHKNIVLLVGGDAYIEYFQAQYECFHGYSDLGAYFVRRADSIVRRNGLWTFICTNTITEGKARDSGLQAIVDRGSTIVAALTGVDWPGNASVVICAPTVFKGRWHGDVVLNGDKVDVINSSLRMERPWAPEVIAANKNLSSTGFLTYARGFVVSPAIAAAMLDSNKRNADVVVPILSATDFVDTPDLKPSQFVINFGTLSESQAGAYDAPFAWVREKVRPERLQSTREDARRNWWLLVGRAERVYSEAANRQLIRVLANIRISKHHAFGFIPLTTAPENNVNVFALDSFEAFALLQCRVHEVWADRQASSLETRRRYTPTTCFATFPFPPNYETNAALEAIGKEYYEYRAQLMVKNNEGLTKTYNRFHDRADRSPEIDRLRDLHAQMDRAVRDAYGWPDLQPEYDFRVQLDESERYTWSEDTRDEVLARLLELNQQRAAEERAQTPPEPPKKGRGRKKKAGDVQMELGTRVTGGKQT